MNKYANILAVLMLAAMLAVMFASSWGDSAIFDEVAHIPAGFTYLKFRDGRLNPEHPPLLKDFAALPLMFLNLKFDKNQPFWTLEDVNERQWEAGNHLLYTAGNNPDQILRWSRLPMILLTALFGWLLFWWVKKNYGAKTGLLSLFFFVTSPTFLAHGRYVTTDVGAALGFFLGIILFFEFLKRQNIKWLIFTGLVFGALQLLKFSLPLLAPIYLIFGILWAYLNKKSYLKLFGQLIIIGLIGLAVIYAAYIWQIWNYPASQQIQDSRYILAGYKFPALAKTDFWLAEHRLTRPLGLYAQGFLMVARRTAGGNTAYFEGELSSKGWRSYFPTLALTKEQLGFYILLLLAIFCAIKKRAKPDFMVLSSIIFVIFYWVISIINPLNIGVRHVLPTFPFLYFLTALGIKNWLDKKSKIKCLFLIAIMFWLALEIAFAFPYYLSYYNELGGGLMNGYKIATDSNYDWGQDLKRLRDWTEADNINKIYLDYFGGGSPQYYLGEKYVPWWSAKGEPPAGSYFAVSLNSLAGNQARPVGDIKIKQEDSYPWLKNKTPIARGGSSILIYRF